LVCLQLLQLRFAEYALGVQAIYPYEPFNTYSNKFICITAVKGTDIGVDVVKTGMLFSSEIILVVKIGSHRDFKWAKVCLVDPVIIAKGGATLLAAGKRIYHWKAAATYYSRNIEAYLKQEKKLTRL